MLEAFFEYITSKDFIVRFVITFVMIALYSSIYEALKSDYSVRFSEEIDSIIIRAHTDNGAKRKAKRLMKKKGYTRFQLRRC